MAHSGITRQLHNWLSVDAALVAVAWQLSLAHFWERPVNPVAPLILALSIWLVYMADRLYDVRGLTEHPELSDRHRFALRHKRKLWSIWWTILSVDCALAFTFLERQELLHGCYLLAFCLIYTGANQLLSKRFFPKELCVALIYVAGIALFIPPPHPWFPFGILTVICLFNCLSIARKETRLDRSMQLHSLSRWFSPTIAHGLWLICSVPVVLIPGQLYNALAITMLCQWLLYINRLHLETETYRILADAALFIGPGYLLFAG